MNNPIILECKRVKFYAPHHEDAFFEWIKKITCIEKAEGSGNKILLFIPKKKIKPTELHELVGLFRRYKINTTQLEIFVKNTNREQFLYFKTGNHMNIYPVKN